jgi:hypothetical protein
MIRLSPEQALVIVEIELFAKMIFFEARGEGRRGMIAVASVARNRVLSESKEFAERATYLSVLSRDAAFDGLKHYSLLRPYQTITGKKEIDEYAECLEIAAGVYFGDIPDNTNGSLFFWAPVINGKTGNPERYPVHCPRETLRQVIGKHYFHGPFDG